MDEIQKNFVETYQCPGCINGSDITCFEESSDLSCGRHYPGTIVSTWGNIFLGLPRGFCRLGPYKDMKINGFREFSDGWGYDKFNIPVWKHKDKNGNTLVRGISPRINSPFLHIFIGDCMSKINCLEITEEDISKMD